jgi:uncharacterized protein YdhG (YjbR/CyaY superfamily)
MSSGTPEVDAYFESLAVERRAVLSELRMLIRATVPDAVETLKYRMPTFEYGRDVLCALASQKHYMSLYMEPDLVEKHRQDLAGLDVGKSCIRFRKLEKLPLDTVETILRETVEMRGKL